MLDNLSFLAKFEKKSFQVGRHIRKERELNDFGVNRSNFKNTVASDSFMLSDILKYFGHLMRSIKCGFKFLTNLFIEQVLSDLQG